MLDMSSFNFRNNLHYEIKSKIYHTSSAIFADSVKEFQIEKQTWGGGGPLDEECLSITHTDRYTHPDGEGRQAKEP